MPKKEPTEQRLRIKIRAYDSKLIDNSCKQIIEVAERKDAKIIGPIPLPTEFKTYTVNRSSFIFKNSREQFELRIHKRIIDILNPSQKIIEALSSLSLPAGIDIELKMI